MNTRKLFALIACWFIFCFAKTIPPAKEKINWLTISEVNLKLKAEKKPVLIDLYTNWCYWCKVMDKKTYNNQKVIAYINSHFYAVKVDGETKDEINWNGKKYIGIGPAAHSYDGTSRQWNISNNNSYVHSIKRGIIPCEKEILTPAQKVNEYIMTSLRTVEGIDLNRLAEDAAGELRSASKKYIERKLITQEEELYLSVILKVLKHHQG